MVLLLEENIISLRTAIVQGDADRVSMVLTPRPACSTATSSRGYHKTELVWLYRRRRSLLCELIVRMHPLSLDKHIKPRAFGAPPRLSLLWADSGQSVAVIVEGIPWAFIHEDRNHGYSKGILRPTVGNPWDQELFENTFTVRK